MTARSKSFLYVLGILFIALNMRAAIISIGPIIQLIQQKFDLSSQAAGFLTTLPVLCFALISPLAPRFSKHLGVERVLWFSLVLLVIGIFIRSYLAVWGLFLGMFLIGISAAVFNVLLPSLIRQNFTHRVGLMTGLYTTVMNVGAAISSGIIYPLVQFTQSWNHALVLWSLPALAAIFLWISQIHSHSFSSENIVTSSSRNKVWTSPNAWYLTLFMGLQSMSFYVVVTWLPTTLLDKNIEVTLAGWMVSVMQIIGLPATFIAPVLAGRMKNQRGIMVIIAVLVLLGFLFLWFDSQILLSLAIICLGIGLGASISIVLTVIPLRAVDTQQAAELSGMVQSLGYLLAAVGPFLIGFLHDLTHSWEVPILTMTLCSLALGVSGYLAGKDEPLFRGNEKVNQSKG